MDDNAKEQRHTVDFEDDQEIPCPNCGGELVLFFCFANCADCKAEYLVENTLGIEKLVRRYPPPSSWKKWVYRDLERSTY